MPAPFHRVAIEVGVDVVVRGAIAASRVGVVDVSINKLGEGKFQGRCDGYGVSWKGQGGVRGVCRQMGGSGVGVNAKQIRSSSLILIVGWCFFSLVPPWHDATKMIEINSDVT